jgi:YHS domain-containing protein
MRYAIFFIIASIMIVNFSFEVWAEDVHMHQKETVEQETSESVEIEDVGNAICPVMRREVNENVSYVYEGRRYYFCCPMCIEEFKKDSEKYIKKMEEAKTEEKECMD